ncbi:protein IMPACT isoform X1 [Gadus chalcogrammus]|uniref:protein IMPACT isoform X1 n=1 Tax=Gadus chalcogrammus TaxID=1042646 RepID=UPI0024C4E5E2|nr:protein IMPACT isoform X1 [Gadus chalcogrammus]XP_056459176.1 protein IMPACT isoform X1 [Gadus chalcogrammus]
MENTFNPDHAEDLQSQIEEVEALSSIYGDEWCVIDEASRIFCIQISNDIGDTKLTACLQVILPSDYPSSSPPIYQINASWLRGLQRVTLANSLEEIYVENVGESLLYLWVETIREFLREKSQSAGAEEEPGGVNLTTEEDVDNDEENYDLPDFRTVKMNTEYVHPFMNHESDGEVPPVKHGSIITDRRSTFQPHLAPVTAPGQVKMVLDKLYGNKKIASATHNIYAYRIFCEDRQSFLQDCEDDGETAAGGRLLHLLQILDVRNVMVVVSRWYGGILLGPDRFKHINNCARGVLVQEGYTSSAEEATTQGGKGKKTRSKKAK